VEEEEDEDEDREDDSTRVAGEDDGLCSSIRGARERSSGRCIISEGGAIMPRAILRTLLIQTTLVVS
jgi:hypothetical protein